MSVSITTLTRYQGKASYSICVDVLCVAVGIVGAMWFTYLIWFIYYCVTIGLLLGSTLVDLTGLVFSWCSIVTSLGITLGGLPGFICYGVSIVTSLGAALGGHPGFLVWVFTPEVCVYCWCCLVGYLCITCVCPCYGGFPPHAAIRYACWFIVALIV